MYYKLYSKLHLFKPLKTFKINISYTGSTVLIKLWESFLILKYRYIQTVQQYSQFYIPKRPLLFVNQKHAMI